MTPRVLGQDLNPEGLGWQAGEVTSELNLTPKINGVILDNHLIERATLDEHID